MPDSFTADLNVGDVAAGGNWSQLEEAYGINLDPARLRGEPAVVEGMSGKGKVLLSLVHFDTPHDSNGSIVLEALWEYLAGTRPEKAQKAEHGVHRQAGPINTDIPFEKTLKTIHELEAKVGELIAVGLRNFLWFWRNPMLLQWRRGVRGLEYCTLFIMMKEIAEMINRRPFPIPNDEISRSEFRSAVDRLTRGLTPFIDGAIKLLVMERLSIQNSHITYEKCDDARITLLREQLFANSKSYGGSFKKLIDEMDAIMLMLLRRR
jgi:hypothetical protein